MSSASTATRGDEFVAEVSARRLASPLDSVLRLTDASGKELAFNDDHEDKASGLLTHHADSFIRFKLPADGTYYVQLYDAQNQGGTEYAYRLRLSAPRPDFQLRVVPSSLTVRAGASVALTVYALRRDGFTGDIALALKDAPEGFALSGARVQAEQDQLKLTLKAPPAATTQPVRLSLEGRATIQGQVVAHPAVPAEDMMQAFAYRHLVPARELLASVVGRTAPRNTMRVLSATPLKIPAGGTARVRVSVPAGPFLGKVEFELSDPPEGISIRSVSPDRDGMEILLECDAVKSKAGLKGNLIISAFAERLGAATAPAAKQAARKKAPLGTLPAVPFEVIGR